MNRAVKPITELPPPAKAAGDIDTVKRLRAIAPGQTIVYYRGEFDKDITQSGSVPNYAAVLHKVRDCARALEAAGVVYLRERTIEIEIRGARKFSIVEYSATGCRGTR